MILGDGALDGDNRIGLTRNTLTRIIATALKVYSSLVYDVTIYLDYQFFIYPFHEVSRFQCIYIYFPLIYSYVVSYFYILEKNPSKKNTIRTHSSFQNILAMTFSITLNHDKIDTVQNMQTLLPTTKTKSYIFRKMNLTFEENILHQFFEIKTEYHKVNLTLPSIR